MALLRILTFPNPFLKTVAKAVTEFDDELKKLADDMFETMYDEPGIGLAAVQVGSDKRLFVMDVFYNREDPESKKEPLAIINPEILEKSGASQLEEGCLSVPGFRAEIQRASNITLKYQDLNQSFHELKAEGLQAICVQHELDHLNGKLFIDHLPPLKRRMVQTRLKKEAKQN